VLLPEVDRLWGVPQRAEYHPEIDTGMHLMMVLDMAARLQGASCPCALPACSHDLGKGTTPADVLPRHIGHEAAQRPHAQGRLRALRVPTECRELADVVAREHGNIHRSGELNSGRRRWCGCWSAATPFASRSGLPTCCWPANATRGAPGLWPSALPAARALAGSTHSSPASCYRFNSCSRNIHRRKWQKDR
jgi:hypothetical protein